VKQNFTFLEVEQMTEFENQGTLIDTVNHAHKRGLFDDIERLRVMKDIRNTIVYEYIEENLSDKLKESEI